MFYWGRFWPTNLHSSSLDRFSLLGIGRSPFLYHQGETLILKFSCSLSVNHIDITASSIFFFPSLLDVFSFSCILNFYCYSSCFLFSFNQWSYCLFASLDTILKAFTSKLLRWSAVKEASAGGGSYAGLGSVHFYIDQHKAGDSIRTPALIYSLSQSFNHCYLSALEKLDSPAQWKCSPTPPASH